MKINFTSFGCKVNISENDSFASELAQNGYTYTKSMNDADIAIINTCAVTDTAANKCKTFITKTKRKYPHIKIVTTGCLISDATAQSENLPIYKAISNDEKHTLVEFINKNFPLDTIHYNNENIKLHTRAFLKIQDGCDAYCSYCIIPSLRGKPISVHIDNVYDNFIKLIDGGYKEIVLVGIHIGLYGKGENYNLYDLLKRLSSVKGEYRIRLSSLEVNELNDKLIKLILDSDNICKHFHIPLQSGCDHTLQRMDRKYKSIDYIDTVKKIRELYPDVTIGSDIIVGFPDESEAHFEETRQTLKFAGTEFFHVFPYSMRVGTKAELMDNHIDTKTKENRANILRNDGEKSLSVLMQNAIGKTYKVLTERGNKGHADNYLLIHIDEKNVPANIFVDVKVTNIVDNKLIGVIIWKMF